MLSSSFGNSNVAVSDNPFQKRILIVSLDYDGCLSEESFAAELAKLQGDVTSPDYAEQYKQILRQTRCEFINDIKHKAQGYDEVVVMIGSNRQTLAIDQHNNRKHKNGSCITTLNYFAMVLEEELRKTVQVDLRMYEDALSVKEPGHFASLLQAAAGRDADPVVVNENLDLSHIGDHKYCMIYLQILQLCLTQPDCEFGFVFYDDKKAIIDEAVQVFGSAKNIEKMMPKNLVCMELVHYRTSILSLLQDRMMELAQMKNSDQVIDAVTIDFLLNITQITTQLADKLEGLLTSLNDDGRTVQIKQEKADRKAKKQALTLAIQQRRKVLYAEMANDPQVKLILQDMISNISGHIIPVDLKHENHDYVIKLKNAVEKKLYEELVGLLLDSNIGIYIAQLPESFNTMRRNQLLPLANKAVQDCQEIMRLQAEINEVPDDYALAALFNLKETMLKQDYINQAKAFIDYVRVNQGRVNVQSLQKYFDGIIKLAELCRIENYPHAFKPGHAYNSEAEKAGFGDFITAVREAVIISGLQLSKMNQADRFCSMQHLKPQQLTCVSSIKITPDSQGAIVRACLDTSLWPDHGTPSLELLYKAYVSAVQLADYSDLCLIAEDVGDEELIKRYKDEALDILKSLNSEYQKLSNSILSKFNKRVRAINSYERAKLEKIRGAGSLEEMRAIAAKYETKATEKIEMGAKLNPNSETAKFMRRITQEVVVAASLTHVSLN